MGLISWTARKLGRKDVAAAVELYSAGRTALKTQRKAIKTGDLHAPEKIQRVARDMYPMLPAWLRRSGTPDEFTNALQAGARFVTAVLLLLEGTTQPESPKQ